MLAHSQTISRKIHRKPAMVLASGDDDSAQRQVEAGGRLAFHFYLFIQFEYFFKI